MNESPLVITIVDFFKDGFSKKSELSLVELLWYFDYRQRTSPTVSEIIKAMEIHQDVVVKRDGNKVYFVRAEHKDESVSDVTDDDLKSAYKQYNKEFWKLFKQLNRDA